MFAKAFLDTGWVSTLHSTGSLSNSTAFQGEAMTFENIPNDLHIEVK